MDKFKYKLEIPYFIEGLSGARNLVTKILLMDLYKIQKIRGKNIDILLNSVIMCKKFDIDRKTYFNSLKKLEELGYIHRNKNSFSNDLVKEKIRKKKTIIIVKIEKLEEQLEKNDLKIEEIKKDIENNYLKNKSENLKQTRKKDIEDNQDIEEFELEDIENLFPF